MKSKKFSNSKKGQTSVEYLLLVGLVVGISILVNSIFAPGLMDAVQQIVTSVQKEAWVGGELNGEDDNRPQQGYYVNTSGICMHSNKGGTCN